MLSLLNNLLLFLAINDDFSNCKAKNHILMYNLCFDKNTRFFSVSKCIKVSSGLHVLLQYKVNPDSPPQWFRKERNTILKNFSISKNYPFYIPT